MKYLTACDHSITSMAERHMREMEDAQARYSAMTMRQIMEDGTVIEMLDKFSEIPKIKSYDIVLKFKGFGRILIEFTFNTSERLSYEEWDTVQDICIGIEWRLRDTTEISWYSEEAQVVIPPQYEIF
jgi:hypothetical protein